MSVEKSTKRFPELEVSILFFTVWKKPKENGEKLLEEVLKKNNAKNSIAYERKAKTSFVIIDSQSVKNTDTAKEKAMILGKRFRESSVTLQLIHKVCRMR